MWLKQWTKTKTYFKVIKNINTFYLFLSVKCSCQKLWFVVFFIFFSEQAIGNDEYNEFHKILHPSGNILSVTEFSVIVHHLKEIALPSLSQMWLHRYESSGHTVCWLFSHCSITYKMIMIPLSASINILFIWLKIKRRKTVPNKVLKIVLSGTLTLKMFKL